MAAVVTMRDVRAAHGCARGLLMFLNRHGISHQRFFRQEVTVQEVEATGDAMAIKVAEIARGRQ